MDEDRPAGSPRRVRIAADGSRVVFLRDRALWVYEVDSARQRLVAGGAGAGSVPGPPGITGYAIDPSAGIAALTAGGRLYRADLATGELTRLTTAGPARDARPDPTGRRIGYLCGGSLFVASADAGEQLLAGEPAPADGGHPGVVWGQAESAASRHYHRHRGWWWAPDGQSILAARVDHSRRRPEVSLHLLHLDGSWVDVHWDRETYPYLVSVDWTDHRDPLIGVLRRPPQHGLVLAVDPRTGETQVHAELADSRWVEPIAGTPCHLADGRVLVGGELTHDGYDARCLFADGTLLTPPWLYVRRVAGRLAGDAEILVEGSAAEPSEQHLYRVASSVTAGGADATPITFEPGWHCAVTGGRTMVVASQSMDRPDTRWAVWRDGTVVGELAGGGRPVPPRTAGRPVLDRVTDRRLPAAVLYPSGHVSGRRLPVLVDSGGLTQGVRAVRRDWLPRQRWADAGFAVVVVDHRGTPGVAPSFEKVVYRRLADLALADLADALAALSGKHPDLDLTRVAIRGHGVGGWLAVLATALRPELFRCALAEDPLLDWATHDPVLAERYLGLPDDAPEVYQRHSLTGEAGGSGDAGGSAGARADVLIIPAGRLSEPEQLGWLAGRLG